MESITIELYDNESILISGYNKRISVEDLAYWDYNIRVDLPTSSNDLETVHIIPGFRDDDEYSIDNAIGIPQFEFIEWVTTKNPTYTIHLNNHTEYLFLIGLTKMELMKEFKVNEYISLKLERGTTNIYVKGELFIQCKFLLLTIPKDDDLEDNDSIDGASEYLDYSLDPDTEYVEREKQEIIDRIKPETEFWAHCSNLQTWAEYNYDTRLLHRNLAFPLLKKLTEEGDLIARKEFKEEIGRRYFTGVESVQTYLEEEGYMKYLSKEEFRSFIHSGTEVINELENIIGRALKISTLSENFPNVLIKNGEIISLKLSHLNLKRIPDCIQRLKYLKILKLVGNSIEEIPEWIGKLNTLIKLIAVNNKIKKILDSIGKLESLEFLDLAVNELEQLPETIGGLKSLEELFIYTNRIKGLPDSIGKLKSLKTLFIGGNLLEKLPETIGDLTNLQKLNLADNPINILPSTISRLPSLRVLELRETDIKKENKFLEELKKKKIEIYI